MWARSDDEMYQWRQQEKNVRVIKFYTPVPSWHYAFFIFPYGRYGRRLFNCPVFAAYTGRTSEMFAGFVKRDLLHLPLLMYLTIEKML